MVALALNKDERERGSLPFVEKSGVLFVLESPQILLVQVKAFWVLSSEFFSYIGIVKSLSVSKSEVAEKETGS